jgi:hypothetical protein
MNDPARSTYSDIAIAPVAEADLDRLDLFSVTRGAEAVVARKRDEDKLRAKVALRMPVGE